MIRADFYESPPSSLIEIRHWALLSLFRTHFWTLFRTLFVRCEPALLGIYWAVVPFLEPAVGFLGWRVLCLVCCWVVRLQWLLIFGLLIWRIGSFSSLFFF
jgi:hypothetical protein